MEKKTISINPDLFTMNKKKKSNKKKTKKVKPRPLIKPNVMQKELLKRIKSHQKKVEENMETTKEKEVISENEFDKHLSYLTKLKEEKKNRKKLKKKKRETKKNAASIKINTPTIDVNNKLSVDSFANSSGSEPVVSMVPSPAPVVSVVPQAEPVVLVEPYPVPVAPLPPPPIITEIPNLSNNVVENKNKFELPSAPPYSCLKGSSIPTYRQWKKNTRKNFKFKDDTPINTVNNMDISDMNIEKPTSKKIKKKKYTKRTYTLGKAKDTNNVGVLIKSNNDRRVVQEEIDKLKNVSLKEVKDYLRKHCLIKVGSNAPNDVLRKIYEDSILSGEINNKTKGTLLHNYMNE